MFDKQPINSVMSVTGLVDVFQNGPSIKIEPFLPGFVETYDLAPDGSVSLASKVRFQEIGVPPVYETLAVVSGTSDGS